MGEQQFYEAVQQKLTIYLETQGLEVCFEDVKKNNNQKLPALAIKREGEEFYPVIYLRNFYEQWKQGKQLEDIVEDMIEVWKKTKAQNIEVPESFFDFEEGKDRLFLRLVNLGMNGELWKDTPFLPWNDLALTVRWMVEESEDDVSSILITNKEVERWGVTVEEVFAAAKENTERLFPAKIQEFSSLSPISRNKPRRINMYILTNTKEINGATALCYSNVVWDFAKKLDSNLLILPSSIHEVILVEENDRIGIERYYDIVRGANETVVEEEDILSYQLYRCNKVTGEIKIVIKNSGI